MQSATPAAGLQGVVHWKTPPNASLRASPSSPNSLDLSSNSPEALLSNLCFLQRMTDAFEEQGNYAECVRSAESCLLLRQSNAAAVDSLLTARQHRQQDKRSGHPSKASAGKRVSAAAAAPPAAPAAHGMVALTDKHDVWLPLELRQQARDVVQRCNSYAVEALRHNQLDTAAFFLNRAMFLTDGEDADDERHTAAAAAAQAGGSGGAEGHGDPWWWRRVLQQQQEQKQPQRSSLSSIDSGTALSLPGEKEDRHSSRSSSASASAVLDTLTPASAAAAFRACFQPNTGDQHLRRSLRAATLNHLGCLEQRRGRPEAAVLFFRMAIRTSAQLSASLLSHTPHSDVHNVEEGAAGDDATLSVASTYLNLCTVLNQLHQHGEAVQVCELVIPLLQQALQETTPSTPPRHHPSPADAHGGGRSAGVVAADAHHPNDTNTDNNRSSSSRCESAEARVATMLVVAYYNLGVSLERRDRAASSSSSSRRSGSHREGPQRAFHNAVQVSLAYRLVPPSCGRSIDAVMQALRHPSSVATTRDTHDPSAPSRGAGEGSAEPPLPVVAAAVAAAAPAAGAVAVHSPSPPPPPPPAAVTSALPPVSANPTRPPKPAVRAAANPVRKASLSARGSVTPSGTYPGPAGPPKRAAAAPPPPSAAAATAAEKDAPVFATRSAWNAPFSATAPPPVLAPLPSGLSGGHLTVPSAPPRPPPPAPVFALSTAPKTAAADTANFAATAPPGFGHPFPPSRGGLAGSANTARSSVLLSRRVSANPFGRRTFGSTLPVAASPSSGFGGDGAAGLTGMQSSGGSALASARAGTADGSGRSQSSPRNARASVVRLTGGDPTSASATPAAATTGSAAETPVKVVSRLPRDRLTAATSGGGAAGARGKSAQQQQRSARQRSGDRRQQREAAAMDAILAEKMYQQLISEKEQTEVERCRRAAVQIQRVWRGVLARTWVATLIGAATRLQRVVRRFLVKARAEHARVAAEEARQRAQKAAQQTAACVVLQRRVRQFLHRLHIRREYRARVTRVFYAARVIQRGYRAFCAQRAAQLAAQAEQHRREDEQRRFREKVAARRIQHAYLHYKAKRAEQDAHQLRQSRVKSVVRIQAVVRGYLTRAWYAYYRVYRREQEVRSAAMQAKLVIIQSACRAMHSGYYGQERALQSLLRMREAQQHRAATRIQCLWRCHVAKIRRARLQAEHDRAVRHATRIQRWYRMRVERRAFVAWLAQQQRERAAAKLQRWVRACWQARKAREFAEYHAALLRQQQLKRLQAQSITVLQACANACVSARLVASVRETFERNDGVARCWQRAGRGFAARKEMALERRAAYHVAMRERERAVQTAAARVLQRAWRCAAAKDTVAAMRREIAAANVVARAYRVYRAKVALATLRADRQRRIEDAAARRIQHAARGYLYGQRAREMDAFYRAEHLKKMILLRRTEAAVMIQSLWRGYVTRRAVEEERVIWQALSGSAATIQRAWRARQNRRRLRKTLAARIVERNHDSKAALTVQCFWRKVTAARRVAQLRLTRQQQTAAASVLQSWWRVQLARQELARRQLLRREEAALEVYYAIQWEKNVTLVNAVLRQRESQTVAVFQLRRQLIQMLTEEGRRRFLSRHEAATKIQALFRGHYERYYTRGLRAQQREEERRAAELAARQRRAATIIQCAYRSSRAREALARLRQAEFDRVQASHAEYWESADPSEVVRELFWLNATYQQRQVAQQRKAEAERRRDAAARIQRLFRRRRARQVVATALDEHKRERAARLLQDYWRHHRDVRRIKENQRRQLAATRLQAHLRGWLVRRGWPMYRAAIEAERQERVLVQDVLDHAAIVLQCFWRRVEAQRAAARLRDQRRAEHNARAQQEAAVVIQDAFRGYQRRRHHAHTL